MTSTKGFSAAERMARTRLGRAGEQRVELWLPKEMVAQLDALARPRGGSTRALMIAALVKRGLAEIDGVSGAAKLQPVALPGERG